MMKKFALMNASDEFLQDAKAQHPDLPARFYLAGADPANGSKLVFVESDLLAQDGYNGFVSAKIERPNTISFVAAPGQHDELNSQAMAVTFARAIDSKPL